MREPNIAKTPTRRQRFFVAATVSGVVAAYVWWFGYSTGQLRGGGSDFDQLWYAAKALIHGSEPYEAVGPGRALEWPWPLLYPMPAVLVTAPLAALPVVVARMLFASLSAGALAYALSREGYERLPILISAAMLDAARGGQLSPLLTASIVLPAVFWSTALKPNLGAALCAATESRSALLVAATGAALLLGASYALNPDWVSRWLAALSSVDHLRVPLLIRGGPFILLAILRWRRLDARILLACAAVPHTPVVYDVLPLGLLARDRRESLAYALLTYTALIAQDRFVTGLPMPLNANLAAEILNYCVYLPCTASVLLRPNEGPLPAWMTLLGTFPTYRSRSAREPTA